MREELSLNAINDTEEQLVRGFFFACTVKSEAECLERLLFGTEKAYGPIVLRIRKGDLLFLNNLTENTLHGISKLFQTVTSIFNLTLGKESIPIK